MTPEPYTTRLIRTATKAAPGLFGPAAAFVVGLPFAGDELPDLVYVFTGTILGWFLAVASITNSTYSKP